MESKSKVNFFGALFLLALFLLTDPSAAEAQKAAVLAEETMVADVSIHNARIVSQDGHLLKIAFDLSNGDRAGVQSGVRYSIRLAERSEEEIDGTADEKIFDERLVLRVNEKVEREVEYEAPKYLSGQYQVILSSRNESGLSLATSPVGKISLEGSGEYLKIDRDSCAFKINGGAMPERVKNNSVYLKKGEALSYSCAAENLLKREVVAAGALETFAGSAFGPSAASAKGDEFSLKAGEKKVVAIDVNVASKPGRYFATLFFSEAGRKISNSAGFEYRLEGPSATITDLAPQKNIYRQGEVAEALAYWSGSSEGAIVSELAIVDAGGNNCAEPQTKKHEKFFGGAETFRATLLEECSGGRMIFSVKDENGEELARKTVELQKYESKEAAQAREKNMFLLYFLFAAIVSLTLVITVFLKFRSRGANNLMLLIFFAALSVFAFAANDARADTYCRTMESGGGGGENVYQTAQYCIEINLDKESYLPGETVTATFDYSMTCLSYDFPLFGCDQPETVRISATVNGVSQQLYSGTPRGNFSASKTFIAPSTVGSYEASYEWLVYGGIGDEAYLSVYWRDEKSVSYGVGESIVNPPSEEEPDPAAGCGKANGKTYPNPLALPPAGSGNYCNPDSSYVDGSFGVYPPYFGQRWWLCGSVWCFLSIAPPPSVPASPVCGDASCNGTETCSTCPTDCGACPPTPPTECVPAGANDYDCTKSAPVCTRENCDREATGTVSCSYSNNCGTFSANVANGMCGNVACTPNTVQCDCSKWIEVAP